MRRLLYKLCKVFGHRWDKSDPYKQPCKRCRAERHLMWQEHYAVGETPWSWKVIDWDEYFNQKLP